MDWKKKSEPRDEETLLERRQAGLHYVVSTMKMKRLDERHAKCWLASWTWSQGKGRVQKLRGCNPEWFEESHEREKGSLMWELNNQSDAELDDIPLHR